MNNSKRRFSTFLIVSATMLLSFFVSDAILSALGHFIVLDRISVFIVLAIAFVFGLVKACSGMKVSEVMLTLLLIILLGDGIGVIGFSILSANYLSAIFLIPLVVISFALIFSALVRRGNGKSEKKGRRVGKFIALLVFSCVLLALVGFAIVYFHAERMITLPALQKLEKAESIDFRSIIGAFEVGFDLNRTILTIALAVAALAALVSSVRHKGKGYGTLTFLLGLFFIDGIGICYFAFATGDYLTGGFLVPLMLIAFGLVIGAIVSRVTGWKPDADLLGKAMLVFALLFLVVFMVGVGFYYVKSNTAPSEVLFDRDLPAPGITTFGAEESLGKGSLVVPLVFLLVTALFLFAATKLSSYPFRRYDRPSKELPWQLLLTMEGFLISFAFIAMGFSFYGVLGPVLIGLAVTFLIAATRKKKNWQQPRSFIVFFVVFLLLYVAGILHFRWNAVSPASALPFFAVSALIGTACAILPCGALRFIAYKDKSRETIKVIAILIAILALIALCLFGYYLRTNVPEPEEPTPIEILVKEEKKDAVTETDKKTETDTIVVEPETEPTVEPKVIIDVDKTPEPECEVVDVPTEPVFSALPKTVLVDTTDLVPPVPEVNVADRTIIDFVPLIPTAPEMNVAESHLADFIPRIPSAPQGLTAWGWTYEDGWDDGWGDWSEDDWVEEDASDEDFWADFFIQGEDELALEDGIYYMNVFINGDNFGEWEINLVDEDPGLSSEYLAYYLEGEITDETWQKIFFESEAEPIYIYLSHLDEIGVGTRFDRDEFKIYLDFSTSMMPVKSISLRNRASFFKARPIEGAVELEPAVFVLNTRWNLSLGLQSLVNLDPQKYLSATLSLSNNMRLFDVYGSFGMTLNYSGGKFNFNFGSWSGYKDFYAQNLKLNFGNINGQNSLGIKLEHSVPANSDSKKTLVSEFITVDKESEVFVYNEGKEIYRRRLTPGNYKLEDFTLFTGANTIEIHIKPIDGSEEQVIKKDVIYSNGLMVPGEYAWGLSFSFGKQKVPSGVDFNVPSGAFSLPWLNGTRFIYDFRNVDFRANLGTGLTPALSFNAALSLVNHPTEELPFNMFADVTFEMTHVNPLGTTRYNFNIKDDFNSKTDSLKIPGLYGRIGHQITFDNHYVSTLNMGLSYASPQYSNVENRHAISVSLGLGGRFGIVGWNLSAFTNIVTDVFETSQYSVSFATSLLANRNFSISANMSVSGNYVSAPVISGRITGSVKFDSLSLNASTNTKNINMSASLSAGNHAFSVSSSSDDITKLDNYSLDGSYSYSGSAFNFGLNFDMRNHFKDAALSMNLSSSSTFADGLMAFGANIPQNFLLISQKGALRGNEISIASIGSSSSAVLPSAFGVSLYAGVSPYSGNGFTIYSTSREAFGNSSSYDIALKPVDGMSGYVLKLKEATRYSISGIVMTPDGHPWINGSSPLYEVSFSEGGIIVPEATEDYMFTDETGRFIINEMKPGYYGFDMDYNGTWILVVFEVVDDNNNSGKIVIYEPSVTDNGYVVDYPYSNYSVYSPCEVMDGEAFWKMMYPDM